MRNLVVLGRVATVKSSKGNEWAVYRCGDLADAGILHNVAEEIRGNLLAIYAPGGQVCTSSKRTHPRETLFDIYCAADVDEDEEMQQAAARQDYLAMAERLRVIWERHDHLRESK